MHYIHTVRTYIFTSIYLGIYILSVCPSIPKVQYLSFFLLILYAIPEYLVFFSSFLSLFPLLLFSSLLFRVGR